jgi:hypothetical protein
MQKRDKAPWYEKRTFDTMEACALDFFTRYLPLTVNGGNREIGAFIYEHRKRKKDGGKPAAFYYSRPFKGRHTNCIRGTILNGLIAGFRPGARKRAFIHTHPKCTCHLADVFSWGDRHVHWIVPGIRSIYLCAPTDPPVLKCIDPRDKEARETVIPPA